MPYIHHGWCLRGYYEINRIYFEGVVQCAYLYPYDIEPVLIFLQAEFLSRFILFLLFMLSYIFL